MKKIKIDHGGYLKEELELTRIQMLAVVRHWYCCGEEPDIFQNESGQDLEEVVELDMDDEYQLNN